MTSPGILLDLSPNLREQLFDRSRLERLSSIGELTFVNSPLDPASRFEYNIVVTGWGSARFPAHANPSSQLQLIAHSAGTIRPIVPRELLAEGVRVTQAASGMAVSVTELAVYMTMAMRRGLHTVNERMRQRDWKGSLETPLGQTIAGSLIGVVGASRIGRSYIETVVSMGADVLVYDPYLSRQDARDMGARLCGLDDLLRNAPLIALHAPVTDETRRMISADRLALIQDDGIIINTARAGILDWDALVAELCSGRLNAAMDVYETEPLPQDHPLWHLPNVMLTPHIGAWTTHSRMTQGEVIVDELERFTAHEPLVFEVDSSSYDRLA
ncbi:hydroxyacid dehydrogenase [Brachybacterium alimentarium]|uniref:hydroxyacid dehydrogenase n=1 Tax=Brachybacterium alimentarium TaxID=47845 RepID=UPI003FCF2EAF